MTKPVVLTGLRANSEFHIGNYLGGILPIVALQKRHAGEYQVNMFVPDLHSFTTPIDHSQLYKQTIDNLKAFVAAGLDVSNSDTYIYRQSFIPAHSELTWILDCFTGFGELSRMTQFKDKSKTTDVLSRVKEYLSEKGNFREVDNELMRRKADQALEKADIVALGEVLKQLMENYAKEITHNTDFLERLFSDIKNSDVTSAGLFNYPVLMAADILLYDAKFIPVGDDQKQHIELARDLAIRLNNKFDRELFTIPEPWNKQLEFMHLEAGARIRSLRNPEKKMSKSVSDPSGTIMLTDAPTEAAKKVMRAETDSIGTIHFDFNKQPGVSNLLQMLALLLGKPQAEVNTEWEGKSSYGDLKKAVAASVEAFLAELQSKIAEVDEAGLIAKLEEDETSMRTVAAAKLLTVQKAVGLRK